MSIRMQLIWEEKREHPQSLSPLKSILAPDAFVSRPPLSRTIRYGYYCKINKTVAVTERIKSYLRKSYNNFCRNFMSKCEIFPPAETIYIRCELYWRFLGRREIPKMAMKKTMLMDLFGRKPSVRHQKFN